MYAILRFQKKTSGKLLNTQKHNERQKTEYKSNPDIDQTRTAENYHLKNPAPDGYKKEISRLIERAGCYDEPEKKRMVRARSKGDER